MQTPGYVMILVEMVHDARIIRLGDRHHENDFDKWMGDSVGYWDGNVLNVETRDFHPQQSFRGSSNEVVMREEFELLGPEKIRYRFTIDDPLTYTQPWTGEVAMNRKATEERMYEYACHEGNYAFAGMSRRRAPQELEPSSAALTVAKLSIHDLKGSQTLQRTGVGQTWLVSGITA